MATAEIGDLTEMRAHDVLFALELEIAQKADELIRQRGQRDELSLHYWLQAEAEVLSRHPFDQRVANAA